MGGKPSVQAGGGQRAACRIHGTDTAACWADRSCMVHNHACLPYDEDWVRAGKVTLPRSRQRDTLPIRRAYQRGDVVQYRGHDAEVVKPLPGGQQYLLQLLAGTGRGKKPRVKAHISKIRNSARILLPSGHVVARRDMRPYHRVSPVAEIWLYNGKPYMVTDGYRIDASHSQRALEREIQRLVESGAVARPTCSPAARRTEDVRCRQLGYRGGCGSNKYPRHCNPGNRETVRKTVPRSWDEEEEEEDWYTALPPDLKEELLNELERGLEGPWRGVSSSVQRERQRASRLLSRHRAASSSSCKDLCHLLPDGREKNDCFHLCKGRAPPSAATARSPRRQAVAAAATTSSSPRSCKDKCHAMPAATSEQRREQQHCFSRCKGHAKNDAAKNDAAKNDAASHDLGLSALFSA